MTPIAAYFIAKLRKLKLLMQKRQIILIILGSKEMKLNIQFSSQNLISLVVYMICYNQSLI